MIGIIFSYAGDVVEVRVTDGTLYFRTAGSPAFATIDGLKLSKEGAIKEHPDLKNNNNWKDESIKRLKEKVKNMKNENEVCNYVIDELRSVGYIPLYKQQNGWRPVKLNG